MRIEEKVEKSDGFGPVARADARVLILGSLPGKVSLERRQYYAQPQNAYWRIMGELTGAGPDLPYKHRLRLLNENGIALWDVCAAGHRSGSLDSAIQLATVETNDFRGFLRAHPGIRLICFNGRKAKEIYDRKVLPTLPALFERIRYEVLPSTSPAHAGMSFEQKLSRWRSVLSEGSASRGLRNGVAPRSPEKVESYLSHQGSLS
jgi:hypoxanthine-DNA glycosylase